MAETTKEEIVLREDLIKLDKDPFGREIVIISVDAPTRETFETGKPSEMVSNYMRKKYASRSIDIFPSIVPIDENGEVLELGQRGRKIHGWRGIYTCRL